VRRGKPGVYQKIVMMHGFIENCQSEINLSGCRNCHGSAKSFSAITYNGPAVWLVAVRAGRQPY